jgi:uroporphyrin-III C-methyltransferase/precorrin-2 dehydrogenase/sirohydrochlorin ferrochelatase
MQYFPAFLDLADRSVLVVGGGAIALRKIELLTRCRARVTVVAPQVCTELRERVHTDGLVLIERPFVASDLSDHWLVVAATNRRDVNAEVSGAALARRIPCNVVDMRDLSTFIMPAVVDRAPVQIAISTGGASPVLARLIRERLETLLDESLGALARFADRWRVTARRVLPSGSARREFLSWLLTGPAAQAIRSHREPAADRLATAELDRRATAHTNGVAGRVTLVGAGPSDPGLLTLKALRALQEADVIIHDRLASSEVIDLARRDAQRIDVGKYAGGGARQTDIHALLVEHASRGLHVVRLKGGDPFVFGRGGEELDYLRAHGVAFEVVPGVSAALAAGAYAGIPLTDRRHAQSVRFLTGNSAEALAAFDFSDVAALRETLAIYMGAARLAPLCELLAKAGVAGNVPVAIVENASRPEQRVLVGTLGNIVALAAEHAVRSPAIIVVGSVAAHAWANHWFAENPVGDTTVSVAA